jgi:hypothetical protein
MKKNNKKQSWQGSTYHDNKKIPWVTGILPENHRNEIT